VENLGASKRKLSVEIPLDQVQKEVDLLVKSLRKEAKIKGFRPGKVPAGMVKRLFAAHIEQEISQKLVEETLPEAMKGIEDTLITQPSLEESKYTDGEPFTFSVTFEVKPEIEVSGYQGLELTREVVTVSEEMVDEKLEELRKNFATTKSLAEDRPVQSGDIAILDYKSYAGDEPLEGGENPNFEIEVGSDRFHKDFETALEGMNKGDRKDIDVSFDEDYFNPKLAGKDVKFDVTLTDIKEKNLPELNDEFVKDLGQGLENMEALRQRIKDDMQQYEDQRSKEAMNVRIRDKLIEMNEIEAPDTLISRQLDYMISQTKTNFQRSGLSFEKMGVSEVRLREDYREEAEKRVKMALILEKISKDQDIAVSDRELDEELAKIAENVGQPLEAVKDIYKKNNMMDSLQSSRLTEKTLNFIIESANIKDVERKAASEEEV
jgi:trigger factor